MEFKLEYTIAIQAPEMVEATNEEYGSDFKDTNWHLLNVLNQVRELIRECGDNGGWYVYDSIRVKVDVEYIPESK
ncbi:hypothetical protein A616_16855 [Brevibacillus brevis X23]|nr:hypothetical protein A616_16855 [Brevibacillus brevis X23]